MLLVSGAAAAISAAAIRRLVVGPSVCFTPRSTLPGLAFGVANPIQIRTATKKAGGNVRSVAAPNPKHRGFKVHHGGSVSSGQIILRQLGKQFHPGSNVVLGRDFTIHAAKPGIVVVHYDVKLGRRLVSVNDGTLPNLPTRTAIKTVLANTVDPHKYLQLNATQRLDYIKRLVTSLDQAVKTDIRDQKLTAMQSQGARKHNLIDLTSIDLSPQ